jgi:hypothetical protein
MGVGAGLLALGHYGFAVGADMDTSRGDTGHGPRPACHHGWAQELTALELPSTTGQSRQAAVGRTLICD